MKRSRLPLILTLAALAPLAHAVNKCTAPGGAVSYQAAPCPDGAARASVTTAQDIQNARPPVDRTASMDLCRAAIKGGILWKDPESVRVEPNVFFLGIRRAVYDAETVATYSGRASGTNSFGGRNGMQTAICEFDPSEHELKRVFLLPQ